MAEGLGGSTASLLFIFEGATGGVMAALKAVEEGLSKLDGMAAKTGGRVGEITAKVGAGVAAGGLAVLGASAFIGGKAVADAQSYQEQLVDIQNAAQLTDAQIKQLGQTIMGAQPSTFGPVELAKAYAGVAGQLTILNKSALTNQQTMAFLDTTTKLAEASNWDLAGSGQALTDVMKAYNIPLKAASTASDILYNASRDSGLGLGAMASQIQMLGARLGPLAPSLGDAASMVEALNAAGMKGFQATRATTQAYTVLLTTSKDVTDQLAAVKQEEVDLTAQFDAGKVSTVKYHAEMDKLHLKLGEIANHGLGPAGLEAKKLGVTLYDASGQFVGMSSVIGQLQPKLAKMTEQQRIQTERALFGPGAGLQLDKVIMKGQAAFDAQAKAVEKSGTATEAAERKAKTFDGTMRTFNASVETAGIALGTALLPVVTQFLNAITPLVTKIGEWIQTHQELAGKIFLVVAAFGAILTAVGAFMMFIGPLIAILGVVGGVLSWVFTVIFGLIGALTGASWAGLVLSSALAAIGGPITLIIVGILLIVAGLVLLITHWKQVHAFLLQHVPWLAHAADAVIKFVQNWKSELAAALTAIANFAGFVASIPGMVGGFFNELGTRVHNAIAQIGAGFDQLGTGVRGKLTDFKNMVGGFFSSIGTFIHDRLMDGLHTVEAVWEFLKAAPKLAFDIIKRQVEEFVHNIIGFFSWLYDHNYYFQDMVDKIRLVWTTAKKDAEAIWSAIVSLITGIWSRIESFAVAFWQREVSGWRNIWTVVSLIFQLAWNRIHNLVTQVWTAIHGFLLQRWQLLQTLAQVAWMLIQLYIVTPIQNAWNWLVGLWSGATTWLKGVWDGIVAAAATAWNSFSQSIKTGIDGAWTWISNLASDLATWASKLAQDAVTWGGNLIQSLIDGIKAKAGDLAKAAEDMGKTIAAFLGFHSPTEEGPGKEADQWMPNLIKMMVGGLQSNRGLLQAELGKLLQAPRAGQLGVGGADLSGVAASGVSAITAGANNRDVLVRMLEVLTAILNDTSPTNGHAAQMRLA